MHRVEAKNVNRPSIGPPQPLQALDGRGLTGAVRPDQPEDLAPPDLEIDTVDRDEFTVGLAEPSGSHRHLPARDTHVDPSVITTSSGGVASR